jgi:osmotically-inducible protein OsmY
MQKLPAKSATVAVVGTALLLSGCVGWGVNGAQNTADQALSKAQEAKATASAARYMADAAQQSAERTRPRTAIYGPRG